MKISLTLTIFLLSLSVQSQESSTQQALSLCREISNQQERLECYDAINTPVEKKTNKELANKIGEFRMSALLADLEEPRIFTTFGRMSFLDKDINAILLGVGTRLKLKTFDILEYQKSIDFNLIGLVKSQFDVSEIDTRNNRGGALINTDFMIGAELVKNTKKGNLRLKYTHRSTHLGDEFLIDNPSYLVNRLNLSYETIDLLAYRNMNQWGTYAGGSFIVRSEPGSLDKFQFQAGVQFRGNQYRWFNPLFGLDIKSWQASNWQPNISFKAGVEYTGFFDRPLQLLFEYYDGKSPYGQFITDDFSFYGLSVNHYW